MAKKPWINIILRDLRVNIGDSRSVVLMMFFKDTTRFPVSFLILKRARPFNFSSHKVICINYGCEWPLGGREKWRIVYIELTDNLSYVQPPRKFKIYNMTEKTKNPISLQTDRHTPVRVIWQDRVNVLLRWVKSLVHSARNIQREHNRKLDTLYCPIWSLCVISS